MIFKCSAAEKLWSCTLVSASILLLVSLSALISYYLSQSHCISKEEVVIGHRHKIYSADQLWKKNDFNLTTEIRGKRSKQIGKLIRSYLDFGVDPCEDFWEFTCGGHNKVEGSTPSWIFRRESELLTLVNRIMTRKPTAQSQSLLEPLQKIFLTCMDAQLDISKSLGPLYKLLNQTSLMPSNGFIFHRLPTDRRLIGSANLARIQADLAKSFNVFPVVFPSVRYLAELNYSQLTIGPTYVRKPDVKDHQDLRIFIRTALHQWPQQPWNESEIDLVAKDALDLQTCLAESIAKASRNQETNMTMKDLSQTDYKFNWSLYFHVMLGDWVNVTEIQLVSKVNIETWHSYWICFSDKPTATVKNYLLWKLIRSRTKGLTSGLRRDLGDKPPENWLFCGDFITTNFPTEIAYVLSQVDYFPSNVQYAFDLFQQVITSYQSAINSSSSIGAELKSLLISKLSRLIINSEIGFPKSLNVESVRGPLRLKNADFLQIVHQIERLKFQKFASNSRAIFRGTPVEFERNLIRGSSSYVDKDNAVIIRLPYLMSSFFNPDYPESWVYGTLANTISHEVAHAIVHSIQDLEESDPTYRKFLSDRNCFVQQYSGDCYQATEEFRGCVDGERTASENLVDWMGLEMSWRTFQRRIDQGQPLIPGLEQYSSAQSFFISFGLKFCDFEIREAMQQMLLKNNHSPKRTRLNGAVRNSATFAQVFNCPTGSAMNHREKCGFIH